MARRLRLLAQDVCEGDVLTGLGLMVIRHSEPYSDHWTRLEGDMQMANCDETATVKIDLPNTAVISVTRV